MKTDRVEIGVICCCVLYGIGCLLLPIYGQAGGKATTVAAAKSKAAAAKERAAELLAVAAKAKADADAAAIESRLADADVTIAESEAALVAAQAARTKALAAREAITAGVSDAPASAVKDTPKVFDDDGPKAEPVAAEPKGMKPEPMVKPAPATITLKVPPQAKVTFDGQPTTGTGSVRVFQTTPLTGSGFYAIAVDGIARKVEVRPGAAVTEDFTK